LNTNWNVPLNKGFELPSDHKSHTFTPSTDQWLLDQKYSSISIHSLQSHGIFYSLKKQNLLDFCSIQYLSNDMLIVWMCEIITATIQIPK
jgi:hypothetical protein